MRVKFITWLCGLLQMDYILAVKLPAGVNTKLHGSQKDLFMCLVAIILSMRNTLEKHEMDLLPEVLQNLIDELRKKEENGDDCGRSETESGSADS